MICVLTQSFLIFLWIGFNWVFISKFFLSCGISCGVHFVYRTSSLASLSLGFTRVESKNDDPVRDCRPITSQLSRRAKGEMSRMINKERNQFTKVQFNWATHFPTEINHLHCLTMRWNGKRTKKNKFNWFLFVLWVHKMEISLRPICGCFIFNLWISRRRGRKPLNKKKNCKRDSWVFVWGIVAWSARNWCFLGESHWMTWHPFNHILNTFPKWKHHKA